MSKLIDPTPSVNPKSEPSKNAVRCRRYQRRRREHVDMLCEKVDALTKHVDMLSEKIAALTDHVNMLSERIQGLTDKPEHVDMPQPPLNGPLPKEIKNPPPLIPPEDFDSTDVESPPQSPTAKELKTRARRKTRIPTDWRPDEQDREYAAERGIDPDWLAGEFLDYWTDPDTRNALHSDWSRVWQRRCRDLQLRQGSNGFARSRQDLGRNQGIVAVVRKLIAESPDDQPV